jgi:hypothetical protein
MRGTQVEDMNSQAAAQQLASGGGGGGGGGGVANLENSGAGDNADDDDDIPELEAVEEEGPLDETGVDPKDIDLVMAQVSPSKGFLLHFASSVCPGQLFSCKGSTSAQREWGGSYKCQCVNSRS